jgi:hypothetical protein
MFYLDFRFFLLETDEFEWSILETGEKNLVNESKSCLKACSIDE